jgi:hypothetical protein
MDGSADKAVPGRTREGGRAPAPLVTSAQRAAQTRVSTAVIAMVLFILPGCSALSRPRSEPTFDGRQFITTVVLHNKPLELHVSAPRTPAAPGVIVLYASGDGGWFGAAVDMFRQIAGAGYLAVGFSSRTFLRIERPRGSLVHAAQLAAEYERIIAQARLALGLDTTSRAVLTGWSRGAAFSVLVGSEPVMRDNILGVVAIGLAEGEDLAINGGGDETDAGPTSSQNRHWPFDTYPRIALLGPLPCAVIQATRDDYLPASSARELFGADTPLRRFYAIEARNHKFAGGKPAFNAAFVDAIHWIVSQPGANCSL